MAQPYKKGRDKGKKRSCWYFDFVNEHGRRVTRKGFTDKQETARLQAKLSHEAALRRTGLIDPALESLAKHRSASIGDHLDAFKVFLESGSNTAKHVQLVIGRIQRIVNGCKATSLAVLDREKVERFLAALRKQTDHGPRTHNHYVQAVNSFGRWLVETGRASVNPFAGLKLMNAKMDVRRQRRSLTDDELAQLIQSARSSNKSIQRFDGETRARIYILSAMTGLRRKELASLTPESFKLDASPPTLTIAAACSKHRRMDILPLHLELVPLLRELIAAVPAGSPLFPRLAKRRTWLMVKQDLERVGIPYETANGVADFHAAGRHTFVTQLQRDGATSVEARDLARHSSLEMTSRYSHSRLEDQAAALAKRNCQWIVSKSADNGCPELSAGVPEARSAVGSVNEETPAGDGGSVVDRHPVSPLVEGGDQWRRRELNPRPNLT